MSGSDNPYGGGAYGGQMTGSAQFGGGASAPPPAGGFIKDTSTAAFAADVIDESRRQPVLVDFWAPWCGPCKQLTPVLEKVVNEAQGRVKLVKLNIDDHPAIPGQMGVQSIPAVVAFVDGRPVDGFMGAVPETQLRQFIDKVAGPAGADQAAAIEAALGDADNLLASGDIQGAAQLYGAVLQADPDNAKAAAGMMRCLIERGDMARAAQMLQSLPPELAGDPAVQAVAKKLEQFEEARKLGDPTALEHELSLHPDNHEARIKLAKIRNAEGKHEEAAEHLLIVMRKDREFEEDGARRLLLEFFEAWGPKDPATTAARRRMSSILFA
ncbi:MAG TPA: thioredoxin [Pseudorhizobium sp.]|jgi:putative thioredoxin|nr:thioredoxin [Pseudorhizobium sp.]